MRKLLHNEILMQRLSVEEVNQSDKFPVSLLLYNIRSLYNVGAMFRTADSAGIEQLILCGYTPHPPRKEIEKTALGAVDTVKWRYEKNTIKAIEQLKAEKIKIIAVELTDNSRPYDSLKIDDYPLCLIVGNEITGIDDEILEMCDDAVEIPMHGVKHSLNVGVATGIAVFEAVKIWKTLNF